MDETQNKINQVLNTERYSRVIPIWKYSLYSLITFGIYNIVWFYKTWKMLAEELDLRIMPLARALLQLFFVIQFGQAVQKLLEKNTLPVMFSPINLGVAFILISVISGFLPTPFVLLALFTFVPLLPFVEALNSYYMVVDKEYQQKKTSVALTLYICLGICMLALTIFGILTIPTIQI
ncbi:MAG: hypothetical protein RI996_365 [Candidatus Parcubacteria bacterium]|jgi:hypothetical protein